MANLTADKGRVFEKDTSVDTQYAYPCATGARFFKGSIVGMKSDGTVAPLSGSAMIAVGVSESNFTAAAGDRIVLQQKGYFFDNAAGGDAITLADVGKVAYATGDDGPVTDTSTGASPVGKIVKVDPVFGVKVIIDPVVTRAGA